MKIFIPTRGRPNRQPTADAFYTAGVPYHLVCTESDVTLPQYVKEHGKATILIADTKTLTEKRQWIMDHTARNDVVLMFDDDLGFYVRERARPGFLKADSGGVRAMIRWFGDALKEYAHAGLVDKFMSQTQPRGTKNGGRYNQVMGYNKARIWDRMARRGIKNFPRFRLPLNQEHDFHLQLLAMGLPPAISCEFSKDAKYYADGGCSAYRTPELELEVFDELKRLWPDFVRLRATKHAIGGRAATFNWRKAAQMGKLGAQK